MEISFRRAAKIIAAVSAVAAVHILGDLHRLDGYDPFMRAGAMVVWLAMLIAAPLFLLRVPKLHRPLGWMLAAGAVMAAGILTLQATVLREAGLSALGLSRMLVYLCGAYVFLLDPDVRRGNCPKA